MKTLLSKRFLTICLSCLSLTFIAGMCSKEEPEPKPIAYFTYSPTTNLVAPVAIQFTNGSTNATSYKWDFGDGTSSTAINPTKQFTNDGTYTVKLTATGTGGTNTFTTGITITSPISSGIVLPSVDQAVGNFMAKYGVQGVSIALVKDDRLVYVKGYGLADKATNTKTRPDHLFRLASISKSITSVAIFKLIEEGKLSLDAKVFGKNALLGLDYGTQPYGKNVELITVHNLLQHTAGGWNNQQNDPMFFPTWIEYSQGELVSTVLNSRPLITTPGSVYDYSNFGYLVLGRIVEKVSGKTYRNYVRETILNPAGISTMDIAGDTEAERIPNEVTYYDAGFSPYAMKVRRMDAHGGWAASATDLARLLVRVNGFSGKPDLLKATSISQMTAPSSANTNYGCGWQVNTSNNWWHTGSLPGTSTIWVRTSTGFGWVVLVNQRSDDTNYFKDLDALMWNGIQGISQWPTQDLF
ncbi:MAG: serine hydrolase [Rudanella sp.]|nr:serine hydrolase [Rudanella sp.]